MEPNDRVRTVKFAGLGRDPALPFSAQNQGLMLVKRNDGPTWHRIMITVQNILRPTADGPASSIVQLPKERRFCSNAQRFRRKRDPWELK